MKSNQGLGPDDVLRCLERVGYLKASDAARLRRLAGRALVRGLAKDEMLIDRTEGGGMIWYVASGLMRSTAALTSGKPLLLDVYGPGDGLNDQEVIDGHAGKCHFSAQVDSVLIGVPRPALRELIGADAHVMRSFAEMIATD